MENYAKPKKRERWSTNQRMNSGLPKKHKPKWDKFGPQLRFDLEVKTLIYK